MAVDAILGNIESSILEPFDEKIVRIVGDVLYLGEGLDPVQLLRLPFPETFGIAYGIRVIFLVLFCGDVSTLFPILRHRNDGLGHVILVSSGQMMRGYAAARKMATILSSVGRLKIGGKWTSKPASSPMRRRLSFVK